ncbi:MAG: hypothetical protein KAT48_12825 [Bacteroidales bacterium]|nr:hypothetical protein [Bacteroidales bacterium]
MRKRRKRKVNLFLGTVLFFIIIHLANGQRVSISENHGNIYSLLEGVSKNIYNYTVIEKINYSFSVSHFFASTTNGTTNLSQFFILHFFNYSIIINRNNALILTQGFEHKLGFLYIADSIFQKQDDLNEYTCDASFPLNQFIDFSLRTSAKTALLSAFNYGADTSKLTKQMITGFLTPLICLVSTGLNLKKEKLISINIGLVSARLNYIFDNRVYLNSRPELYYGVRRGQKFLFEYGLSTHVLVDKKITDNIFLKCDIKAFKNYNMPCDVDINNTVTYKTHNHFKTSIETGIKYDEKMMKTVQLKNMLTIGFYFDP